MGTSAKRRCGPATRQVRHRTGRAAHPVTTIEFRVAGSCSNPRWRSRDRPLLSSIRPAAHAPAKAKLVLDRAFALVVRRIAGIERDAGHRRSPFLPFLVLGVLCVLGTIVVRGAERSELNSRHPSSDPPRDGQHHLKQRKVEDEKSENRFVVRRRKNACERRFWRSQSKNTLHASTARKAS